MKGFKIFRNLSNPWKSFKGFRILKSIPLKGFEVPCILVSQFSAPALAIMRWINKPVWIRMWTLFFIWALFFLHELSHVLSQPGKSQVRIGSRGLLETGTLAEFDGSDFANLSSRFCFFASGGKYSSSELSSELFCKEM